MRISREANVTNSSSSSGSSLNLPHRRLAVGPVHNCAKMGSLKKLYASQRLIIREIVVLNSVDCALDSEKDYSSKKVSISCL